jgi:uncharacterized protein (DUF3820 family)
MVSRRSQSSGVLDPRERKLLRLALDRAAQPGEIRTSAIKLIESWRMRGVCVEHFDQTTATLTAAIDYGNKIVPFGRYKGERLRDVPADYLKWLAETDNIRARYPDVVKAVREILKRGVV